MTADQFIKLYSQSHFRGAQSNRLVMLCKDVFKLDPSKVIVVHNKDWRWNKRSNRTENDRKAVKFGQSNSGLLGYGRGPYINYCVWAFPAPDEL